MTKTWIAAAAAAVLLVGGGLGGYFIGRASDYDGKGWHHRYDSRGDFGGGFRDGPSGWDGPWYRGDR